MIDLSRILDDINAGKPGATDELFPLIYQDLKQLAASKLSRESNDHTLQPTALVHEAYLRLIGNHSNSWSNRAHSLARHPKRCVES